MNKQSLGTGLLLVTVLLAVLGVGMVQAQGVFNFNGFTPESQVVNIPAGRVVTALVSGEPNCWGDVQVSVTGPGGGVVASATDNSPGCFDTDAQVTFVSTLAGNYTFDVSDALGGNEPYTLTGNYGGPPGGGGGAVVDDEAEPVVEDADGDGTPDAQDNCPTEAGPDYNGGCPLAPPNALANWNGNPNSPTFDHRLNPGAGEPYVAYCAGNYVQVYNPLGGLMSQIPISSLQNTTTSFTCGSFTFQHIGSHLSILGPNGLNVSVPFSTCTANNGPVATISSLGPFCQSSAASTSPAVPPPPPPPQPVVTTLPSGEVRTLFPDGTLSRRMPNGVVITIAPDGTNTTVYPDGTTIRTLLNGTITTIYPNGSVQTILPNGTILR